MAYKYDIQLRATVSIGGVFEANTAAEAIEAARRELRSSGHIDNVETERAIMLDDPEPELPENVISPMDLL